MYIHKEGYKHITIATLLWIGLSVGLYFLLKDNLIILYWILQVIFFALWFWVLWFFRIPERTYSKGADKVVAPADGKVVVIEEVFEPEYFKDKRLQVSIFMSPLNVHVNRSPITGIIKYVKYHPGLFLVAWHPKSSTDNERTTIVIENKRYPILLRQVAGAMARRIVYYAKEGKTIEQNAEFGFIKFGSRVDMYFPVGTPINVKIGDKVQGGVSIIAQH